MAGNHSFRWCCPHGWNFQDHRQTLWRRIASFLYMYHRTVWSLHQVPQMWKWQPLDILDVVHGYDRYLAGLHPSIQRRRLYATQVWHPYEPWSNGVSHMTGWTMHAIYHVIAPRCISWTQRTHICTLNSCKEGFQVKLGSDYPFGRIPVDQMIDETVNKDTQTPRGPRGFRLKPGAVSRYYLTAEYRAVYLKTMRDMIGQGNSKPPHPDM